MGNSNNSRGRIIKDESTKKGELLLSILKYFSDAFIYYGQSPIADHYYPHGFIWSGRYYGDISGETWYDGKEERASKPKVPQSNDCKKPQTGEDYQDGSGGTRHVANIDTVESPPSPQAPDCEASEAAVKHEDDKGGACANVEVKTPSQPTPQSQDKTSQAGNSSNRFQLRGFLWRIFPCVKKGTQSSGSKYRSKSTEKTVSQLVEDTGEGNKLRKEISNQLQRDLTEKVIVIEERDETISQLRRELEARTEELKKQKVQMSEMHLKKDEQIKDLTNRLASEMGTKVAADESSLENINIKDRPMNIASEYELLCSNQWLVAKTGLDEQENLTEEISLQFLSDILLISLTEATNMKKSVMHGIGTVLSKPGITAIDDCKVPKCFSLSEKLMQNFMDLQRQTVDETNLTLLYESIIKELKSNSRMKDIHYPGMLESQEMVEYINSVAVFTWKMVLQRPPMSFRLDGIGGPWQGETKQEVFWNSSDPLHPDSRVVFYVHPALYHGEAMMVKGRVFLSKKGLQDGQ